MLTAFHSRWCLAFALCLTTVACDGAEEPDAGPQVDAGGARVELGEGTSRFETLTDGQDVELIAGVQGGYHINLTGRLYGFALDDVTLDYEAVPVGATAPISMPTQLVLDASDFVPDSGGVLRAGDFLIMEVETPADVVGMELDVTLTVTDAAGETASDTRRVRVVDEENELVPG